MILKINESEDIERLRGRWRHHLALSFLLAIVGHDRRLVFVVKEIEQAAVEEVTNKVSVSLSLSVPL